MSRKQTEPKGRNFGQRHFFGRYNEPPLLNETGHTDVKGKIVRYALAYIDFDICQEDNGRVLGYDNAHGFHERHFMGKAEKVNFTTYAELAEYFLAEVKRLRTQYGKD